MRVRRVLGLAPFCLLVLVLSPRFGGSVLLVYNTVQHPPATTRFEDVPAKKGFGPRVPEEGFAGRLELAKPDLFACSPLDGPAKPPSTSTAQVMVDMADTGTTTHVQEHAGGAPNRGGWGRLDNENDTASRHRNVLVGDFLEVDGGGEELPSAVLISRSIRHEPDACTFEAKVLNAQAAGYSAVIVYDSEQGKMFQMSRNANKGSQHPAVNIPLVLVTHASGLALMALIAATSNPRGPEIYLDNADPYSVFVTVNLTMFMVVTGFMLALLTCGSMMVVTLHRYLRRYESLVASTNRPMSLPEVLQLPEVVVEAGSRLEGDSCPVCLEPYRLGDRLRNLPCQHAFHAGCITPWLTQRQRTCPMCKDPITIRPVPAPSSSTSSATMSAPLMLQDLEPASIADTAGGEGEGEGEGVGIGPVGIGFGLGLGGGGDGAGGDRLPLLSNSRGVASDGGSIQDPSPA